MVQTSLVSSPRFRWMGLEPDGKTVILRHYDGEFSAPGYATPEWFDEHLDEWRVGAVLDVETTGTQAASDKIIEIGVRLFRFHRETGEVLCRDEGYGALEDPQTPLSEEITRITGITDEMVRGQKIDWPQVQALLERAQLVIAHNAQFDRAFIDRYLPVSSTKIWACTFRQIDWSKKGFPSQKLEILAIYHGFFCTAHRALADADTLLHLLAMPDPEEGVPYLKELLINARRPFSLVCAVQSPIETKDLLKSRSYRWDGTRRVWHKLIYSDECAQEAAWLTQNIYNGHCRAVIREMALCDGFKPVDILLRG